jgi:hypothetical protein
MEHDSRQRVGGSSALGLSNPPGGRPVGDAGWDTCQPRSSKDGVEAYYNRVLACYPGPTEVSQDCRDVLDALFKTES